MSRAIAFIFVLTTASELFGQTYLSPTTMYDFRPDHRTILFGKVSGVGDVNADGFDDVAVGSYLADHNGTDSGYVRVYSGRDGSLLYQFDGDAAGDQLGWSVRDAGDVDGDGYDDIIAGMPGESSIVSRMGAARVFSGRDGSVLHTFRGTFAGEHFGRSVSGAGDLDQDGFDDLLVGAPFANHGAGQWSGRVWAFSGRTGAVLHTFDGAGAYDRMGWSVSDAGDVDRDGHPDVIAGAAYAMHQGARVGSATIYSGRTGAVLFQLIGDAAGDRFGVCVNAARDVDRDGHDDFLVGADYSDRVGPESGLVRVFSGFDGSVIFTLAAESDHDHFGVSADTAGDLDLDGYPDILVGAWSATWGGRKTGRAYVFSGRDGHRMLALPSDRSGGPLGGMIGTSVSAAGDLDGDGRAEVLVAAPLDEPRGTVWAFTFSGEGDERVARRPISRCPGTSTAYGSGCSGSGGFVPTLDLRGCAALGRRPTFELAGGLGGAPAQLLVGLQGRSSQPAFGCTLLVQPPLTVLPTSLSGPAGAPGAGSASLLVTIPLDPRLIGLRVNAQGIVQDPGAARGFAFTDALEIVIG